MTESTAWNARRTCAMTGREFLLDSVIVIDHFNGVEAATAYLKENGPRSCVTAITRAEVLTGFEGRSLVLAKMLLDRFPLVVIDAQIADIAAKLRRQKGWKLPDAMQAAAAKHNDLLLVTRDVDDFPPSRHRFVRVPYTL